MKTKNELADNSLEAILANNEIGINSNTGGMGNFAGKKLTNQAEKIKRAKRWYIPKLNNKHKYDG